MHPTWQVETENDLKESLLSLNRECHKNTLRMTETDLAQTGVTLSNLKQPDAGWIEWRWVVVDLYDTDVVARHQ